MSLFPPNLLRLFLALWEVLFGGGENTRTPRHMQDSFKYGLMRLLLVSEARVIL